MRRGQAQAKGQKLTMEQMYDRVFAAPREAVVRNFEAVQGMLRWDGLRCILSEPSLLLPRPTHPHAAPLISC